MISGSITILRDPMMSEDYERLFEDDLDGLSLSDDEMDEKEAEDYLTASILMIKEELRGMAMSVEPNHVDGWSELISSIQTKETELSQLSEQIRVEVPAIQNLEQRNHQTLPNLYPIQSIEHLVHDIEISDEVREIVFEMITSIEYTASLEILIPVEKTISLVGDPIPMIKEFEEFPEDSFQPSILNVENLSENLLEHESQHQLTLQNVLREMEIDMKRKEEEYRRTVEEDLREREERKERVKKEVERLFRLDEAATKIQSLTRKYIQRRTYLMLKLELKERKERRREKEERNGLQREDVLSREYEKWTKKREEEERQRLERMVMNERKQMAAEEKYQREFLAAKQEAERMKKLREEREIKERLEKEKAEREMKERLRLENERLEAERLLREEAERERKVKEEEELREAQARIERERKAKQERDEVLRLNQEKEKEKEKRKKYLLPKTDGTLSKKQATMSSGQLPARNGIPGFGGEIETFQPILSCENHDQTSSFEESSKITSPSQHQLSDEVNSISALGPILDIPKFDEQSVLTRIVNSTRESIHDSKLPVVYGNNNPHSQSQKQKSTDLRDLILHLALRTWRNLQFHKDLVHLFPRQQLHSIEPALPTQSNHAHELQMSVEGLQNLSVLSKYPYLKKLECNVNQISDLIELSRSPCSITIEELSLNDNILTSLKGIESCSSLRILSIDVNQLVDLTPLHSLSQLVSVSAKMNRLSVIPNLPLPTLQRYDLYHNRIETISKDCFRSLPLLIHLDLGRNKLTSFDGSALSHCQLLTHLILSQNQLSSIPTSLHLPNLRCLWLSGNKITELDPWNAVNLDESERWPIFLPLLEKLFLQDNEIATVPSHTFDTSPLLSELDLSFNRIDPHSIEGILTCSQLKVLQLQENPIAKDSVQMKHIQNTLYQLREFCGNSVDVMNGMYYLPSNQPPLSILELKLRKETLALERRKALQFVKENGWDNLETIFRLPCVTSEPVKHSPNLMELTPFQPRVLTAYLSEWFQFLSTLVIEQNLFKSREKSKSLKQSPTTLDEKNKMDTSYVDLLYKHYQLVLLWDQFKHNTYIINYGAPQLPTPAQPIESSKIETKKEHKEMISVIHARQVHAAIAIQSLWRGQFVRRKLSRLLTFTKYHDDDLDEIMDDQKMSDYLGILQDLPPELADDWIHHRSSEASTMVYGDHRRKRPSSSSSPRNEVSKNEEISYTPYTPERTEEKVSPRAQMTAIRMKSMKNDEWVGIHSEKKKEVVTGHSGEEKRGILEDSGVYISRIHEKNNPQRRIHEHLPGEEELENDELANKLYSTTLPSIHSQRPSDLSSRPASSSSTISGTSSQRFGKGNYDMDADVDLLLLSPRSRTTTASSEQNGWGLSNPTAVGAMLKRNKKKVMSETDPKREKELEKDPSYRYEKYSKIFEKIGPVDLTKGNTKSSGSFGGRPKVVRNTRSKKHGPPPAWLMGPPGADEEEK